MTRLTTFVIGLTLLCGVGIVLFAFFLALEAAVTRLYDSR